MTEVTEEMRDKFRDIVLMKIEIVGMKERIDSSKHISSADRRIYEEKLENYIIALEDLDSLIFAEVLEEIFNGTRKDEERTG